MLHGRANGQIMSCREQKRESFTNAFSSNLSTVNLKTFPKHGVIHT